MTLSTLPMSQAVRTPRASPCEPLCARLGAGVALCTRRGDIQPAQGKFRDGIKTANTPPSPLRVQRFSSMKRTPEGSDTTPTQKCRKNAKRELLSPPPTGLPPKPSEAVSVGRGRATERAGPAACGGTRDSSSARTTASIAFVWSAAKPLPCQMHWAGKALHPNSGQKPGPTFSYDWRKT